MSQRLIARRLVAAAALMALTLVVAACGSSGPGGGGGSTSGDGGGRVAVWALQDVQQQKFENPAVEAFNASGAGQASLSLFPGTGQTYLDKLRVAMGSSNAPDVFFNWGGGSIKRYADARQLKDLGAFLKANPDVNDAFLPSVLDAGKIDGTAYGVPMRGMQPVLLFYNTDVLRSVGAQPPKTWDDVQALIPKLKDKGVVPFSVAGQDPWTELMWLEYLTDRIGGRQPFLNLLAGKPGAWKDPAITKALTTIDQMIKQGAFGTNFGSVGYGSGAASQLFSRGKAAMMLMGTWEYTNQLQRDPQFAKSGLGWTTFPSVPGGTGDPAAVVGNPTNFFSVNAKAGSGAADFLKQMVTPEYVKNLISVGDVPAVKGIETELKAGPNPRFSTQVYELVQKAPTFTLSWDQAVDPQQATEMITNLQRLFAGQIDPAGFQSAMEQAAA
jgi:xylobiose transport system substrate-binding protein